MRPATASVRAAALRPAVLPAGFRHQGQSRGRVVSRARWSTDEARRARPDRDGTIRLRSRNSRLAVGRDDHGARAALGRRQASLQNSSVPYQKWMRVLDALNWIAENGAPDLAYRWFCGSKMCGTCAVRMNGREVLACWEAVEPDMTIEPLRNLPVIRDLDRRPHAVRTEGRKRWSRGSSARRPMPAFPSRSTTRT